MRHHRQAHTLIGVSVAFATILFGQLLLQMQGQTTSQTASGTGVIQGMVLRAGTGQPLKRAQVSLRRVNGSQPLLPNISPAAGAVMQQVIVGVDYQLGPWTIDRHGFDCAAVGGQVAVLDYATTL